MREDFHRFLEQKVSVHQLALFFTLGICDKESSRAALKCSLRLESFSCPVRQREKFMEVFSDQGHGLWHSTVDMIVYMSYKQGAKI